MIQPMKVLTIWNPWAWLIAILAKRYETRSWATSYRGPLAIHAAALKPSCLPIDYAFDDSEFTERAAKMLGIDLGEWLSWSTGMDALPRGCIIATAELVGCWRIAAYVDGGVWAQESVTGQYKNIVTHGNEGLFGDWTSGRYAWELRNVQMLPEPIPAKGRQGLWNWEGAA